MSQKTCYTCGTIFYTNLWTNKCNICQQTDALVKNAQRQAAADRARAREIEEANARHTQALINAENQRIAAINHQTQVIEESIIPSKDAYQRGNDYPDIEFKVGNRAQLEVEVGEYGGLTWKWYPPYVTDRLNNEFSRGLYDRLNNVNVFPAIKASAYQAGRQNANGSLPSRFTLTTGLSLAGIEVKTKVFDSKFTNTLDETTGEQKMRWSEPFANPELNQAYLDGVNEVHWEVNTEEQKNYRLRVDVPNLKAEREIAKSIKRFDKIYKASTFILPILFFYIMWQITSGWATFFGFVFTIVLYKLIKKTHLNWQTNNKEYLT